MFVKEDILHFTFYLHKENRMGRKLHHTVFVLVKIRSVSVHKLLSRDDVPAAFAENVEFRLDSLRNIRGIEVILAIRRSNSRNAELFAIPRYVHRSDERRDVALTLTAL